MYSKSNSSNPAHAHGQPRRSGFAGRSSHSGSRSGYSGHTGQSSSRPSTGVSTYFSIKPPTPSSGSFGGYRPSSGGSSRFSRPSSGSGSRFGGASRFGGNRFGGGSSGSRFGGGSRGGGRGRFASKGIDPSRFINKAVITEEVEVYVPEHAFKDFKVDERLKKNIARKGYVVPTPIQDKSIPHILRGEDVVGIANTGTGKTAAFLLPLINKVLTDPIQKILVVAPTRELAIQIDSELLSFVFGLGIWSVCAVGGAPIGRQISNLKLKHQFVIGTPGRIKDLIERKALDLSKFQTVVLDEADRMLDMGFINDMKFLMAKMPAQRHTLFFSATLSNEIEALIKDFLRDPVRISVKTQDTSKNVHQDVVRVLPGKTKIDTLHDMLTQPEFTKVLIFGRTKHGVEKLSDTLIARGFKVESLHGDKNHSRRQRSLQAFRENKVQVLVATDVAARGLDLDSISHVINYDLPSTYEDYVHRIGRTGRGDKKGKALTFVD